MTICIFCLVSKIDNLYSISLYFGILNRSNVFKKGVSSIHKVINIQNVSWARDGKQILQKIHWEVLKGENWTVFGLNGSGKTTLLSMINGYLWPTTGEISVLGEKFGQTDVRELRKSIGWVSSSLQERVKQHDITQHIVVSGKYASIGLYEIPTKEDFDQAYKLMKQLDCHHLVDRIYQTCSNGEKQRILIARSLMAYPELLILDEPSNGLDFIAREELMSTIDKITKQDDAPTIILVTHHVEEMIPTFTHTLLLKDGMVFEQGKSKQLINSSCLSRFFEKQVQIKWQNDRPWLSLLS